MATELATVGDVQQYMAELHSLPVLAPDEYRAALAQMRAYRQGRLSEQEGQAVKMRLLHTHLWDVVKVAFRHGRHCKTLDVLDLIQEGNLAWLKMLDEHRFEDADRFNGSMVAKKASWAMLDAMSASHPIYVSKYDRKKLHAQGQDDVLEHVQPISLDQNDAASEPDEAFTDSLPAHEQPAPLCDEHKARLLRLLLACLPESERQVLCLHFGLGDDGKCYDAQELADQLEVQVESVKDIEQRAIKRLRKLYQTYEHTTGRAVPFLSYDPELFAYLERQAAQKRSMRHHFTRPQLRAHLDAVCRQLRQQGRRITINGFAVAAQVEYVVAHRYLLEQGLYQPSPSQLKRLTDAYLALQQQGQVITRHTLKAAAHVEYPTACWYLQHRRPQGASHA